MALLAEAAAEEMAASRFDIPAVVTELDLRYLAQTGAGPVRSRCRLLGEGPDAPIEVELFDISRERLTTLVYARTAVFRHRLRWRSNSLRSEATAAPATAKGVRAPSPRGRTSGLAGHLRWPVTVTGPVGWAVVGRRSRGGVRSGASDIREARRVEVVVGWANVDSSIRNRG